MPENTPTPRPLARALAAAGTALLLAVGGLLIASPANAHDELVSTDPAADTVLDALPPELTLTFSGELATDPGATVVQVTDAAGTALADGEPAVEGTVVTQALAGAASGAVTVLWKVVSSDGHPISGEFAFSVSAPATPTPTATATPTPSASPSTSPADEPTTAPTEAPVPADSGNTALPWMIGGVVALAVIAAVTYLLVSRARRRRAEEALRAGTATPSAGGSETGSEPSTDR